MSEDRLDLVLITHSQGFGFEYPNQQSYPQLLQELLDERPSPVTVHNWSSVGAHTPSIALLLAAADWAGADAVVLVTGPRTFMTRTRNRRGRPDSDSTQLLSWSPIRSRLKDTGIEFPTHTVLDAYLARYSAAWRLREVPRSLLLALRQRLAPRGGDRGGRLGAWFLAPGRGPQADGTPSRRPIDIEQLGGIAELTQRLPEVVWVDMPMRSNRGPERDGFETAVSQLADPPHVEDWSRRFGDELFETSVHFNRRGHVRMARDLMVLLEDRGVLP